MVLEWPCDDYRDAVNKERKLGLKHYIYDKFDYPSGKMGGGVNSHLDNLILNIQT